MKGINITRAEWKVVDKLWKGKMLSMKEIIMELKEQLWKESTIKTLVLRLVEKGIITKVRDEGVYKFIPNVSEEECKQTEASNLINDIFNGSIKMLMSTLVSDTKLTDSEIDKIMSIVDKIEGEK